MKTRRRETEQSDGRADVTRGRQASQFGAIEQIKAVQFDNAVAIGDLRARLCTPDLVPLDTPHHQRAPARPSRQLDPCVALRWAMVERAVADVGRKRWYERHLHASGYRGIRAREYTREGEQALAWVFGTESDYGLPFDDVCDVIGICAARVRVWVATDGPLQYFEDKQRNQKWFGEE